MYRFLFISAMVVGGLGACGDNREAPAIPPDGMLPDGEMPTEIPISQAHAGGTPNAIAVVGTRAYVGVGPRLAIWDLAATPPVLIGETAPLRSVIAGVAVRGDRAYVVEHIDFDSLVHVYDVMAPATPVETHTFSVATGTSPSVVRDVAVGGDFLYIADQEQGVFQLDLSNPDTPSIVNTAAIVGVTNVDVVGSRLYYTSESFFGGSSAGALDLDNGMADLGSSPLGNLRGIAFAEPALAVGAGPDGIYVYDVTAPAAPVELFHTGQLDMGPFARAIAAHGTTAWVPADDALHTLDLSNPSQIVDRTQAIDTTNVNATAASSDMLAIATDRGRLLSFGLANPLQLGDPRVVDVTLCANCDSISIIGATAHVGDMIGGLRPAQLADLTAQGRSAALPVVPNTGGLQFVFEDVYAVGSYAYVADWLYGLRIYDVTSPATPALVGAVATGGAPSAVTVIGDRAYVAEGTGGGWLKVVDVSSPTAPTVLGGYEVSKGMDVEVRDHIAYIADESVVGVGGLRILNVSNPTAITELGLYNTDCLWPTAVALSGNLAVVACAQDGFHWVDVSDPSHPTRVAVTPAPTATGSALAVTAWDGHVALGHDRGVIVVDATSRQPIAKYATAWPVRTISVPTPGRIVAACGWGGVYQWAL